MDFVPVTSLSHQSRWCSHRLCLCALGDKLLELLGPLVLLYPLLLLEPDALRSQGLVSEKGWDCLVIFYSPFGFRNYLLNPVILFGQHLVSLGLFWLFPATY